LNNDSLYEQLIKIVGQERVSNQDFARLAVSVESTAIGISFLSPFSEKFVLPKVVVKPQTTKQVVEIIKLAIKTKTPIIVRGGGCGGSMGTVSTQSGILIDMTDMDRIVEIDEPSMAVIVQAGITWGKLRHELNKHGFRPGPLGPHGTWGATIGGALSYDSCCIDANKYGQLSEDVLTLQVVLPNGDIIETGSQVNPKSHIYHRYCNGPDLAGLFLGASGALGVITEATVRIYPKEKYTAHATFGFRSLEDACKALHEISRSGYTDDFWMLCGKHTVDLGYPQAPEETESIVALYAAAQYPKIIDVRKEKWMETAKKYEVKELDPSFADKYASDYTGIATAAGQSLSWGVCNIWPIKRIPEIYYDTVKLFLKYEDIMKNDRRRKLWSVVAVGGAKHPMCDFCYGFTADRSDPEIRAKAYEALQELQKMAIEHGAAFYDLGRLPAAAYLWEKAESAYALLKAIKKALDPNNIMNPGSLML